MKRQVFVLATLALSLISSTLHADSLHDIYELALENDAQLKAERATYLAKRETEILGRSRLLPQVSGSYTYRDSETDAESISPVFTSVTAPPTLQNTKSNRDIDNQGYRLSLSQALFDLPAWFSFQSGKQITKEAEATFAANQQNLIVRVVEAYLLVLRAGDNLSASQAQERAFDRQLEQTQQRFEVGLIAITDVYEAQAARDLAQVQRIENENRLSVAQERLSVLTGNTHSNLHILRDDFRVQPPEPLDRAAWVDFSLANNLELKAAMYREEAARQTSKAKKLEHAPKISGAYEYSDFETNGSFNSRPSTGIDSSPDGNSEESAWQISITVPLFSGGAVSSNRRKAAQEFNAAREQRINLSRNTITNTRSLHMTVLNDISRVSARRQSIVSSTSAFDATQAGYEVGTRNVVDVLNSQNSVFSAERDFANSRYDYILNMMRLKEQAGLLSPQDVIDLNDFLEPPTPPTATQSSTR